MGIRQVKGRVTKDYGAFQKYSLSSNSFIYSDASDDEVEEYSIELTIGEGWSDAYSEANKNLIKISDEISIQGNGSVVIEVAQEIRMPHNNYGVVLSTGKLFLSKGVLIATAKVEPSFEGKLKLRVFNTTKQRVTLKQGEKLGSVIFFQTESTKVHSVKSKDSHISNVPTARSLRLKKWLAENKAIWVSPLVSLLVMVLTIFFTYLFFWKPNLELLQKKNDEQSSEVRR